MAEFEKVEFEFPDEIEAKKSQEEVKEPELEIEIEDDTPEKDRNRKPLAKEVVEDLDKDPLDEYTDKVKNKLINMKRVWHDERREKERALREQQEAIAVARRMLEENQSLKARLNTGEQVLQESFKETVARELEMAKREYKEAYDAGDSDKLVDAQEKIAAAKIRADKINNFRPTPLQEDNFEVQTQQERYNPPRKDPKAASWQERNSWFGQDEEMTALALGLHEKLVKENGVSYATTDEYYKRIDTTMRKRFPEQFEEQEETVEADKPQRTKPSTVVAPATRSTGSKKIKLTNSQMATIKKLGITPEQYVREVLKMEAR
jgi:hypothetical protein